MSALCQKRSRPSALAVLRLMISSNFVGAFAPYHRLRDVDAAIEICGSGSYMRELSDNPILRAFRHVALSVRFRFLAILPAGVFFRASAFNSRTCAVVQARLLDPFFTIRDLRFLKRSTYSSKCFQTKVDQRMKSPAGGGASKADIRPPSASITRAGIR